MLGIIDYNAGNIKSVERALAFLKAPYLLSKDPKELENCDKLLFPGVGDAAFAMKQLKATGFETFIKEKTSAGIPLFGICLGSQIIFDFSEEGDVECLGLLKGKIRHFEKLLPAESKLKIPHMGWNNLEFSNGGSYIFDGVNKNSDFYFVHSYVIQPEDSSIIKAVADYGIKVPACVQCGNILATQFHPEKSGEPGLKLLSNFIGGAKC